MAGGQAGAWRSGSGAVAESGHDGPGSPRQSIGGNWHRDLGKTSVGRMVASAHGDTARVAVRTVVHGGSLSGDPSDAGV